MAGAILIGLALVAGGATPVAAQAPVFGSPPAPAQDSTASGAATTQDPTASGAAAAQSAAPSLAPTQGAPASGAAPAQGATGSAAGPAQSAPASVATTAQSATTSGTAPAQGVPASLAATQASLAAATQSTTSLAATTQSAPTSLAATTQAPRTSGLAATGLSGSAADEVARLVEAVNAIRGQNGRPPLHLQAQLVVAAQRHADGMAQSRTMSHIGPYGSHPSDRMGAAGYETCGGGEDVSFGALQSPDDIARGWYDSPGHRAIMLDDKAREMGVGRGRTTDGVAYWALEVGQRPTVAPIVINGEAAATPTSNVVVYVYPQVNEYCLGPSHNVVQVTLSNTPDFAYAQTFDYASSFQWTLAPGEGARTLYARLTDSTGQTVDVQDDIVVSAAARPSSTAADLTPSVQTVNVAGPNGSTTPMTIYRTSTIVPPNAAVTTTPCPGTLTGCWTMSSAGGTAGAPVAPTGLPGPGSGSPGALGVGGPWGAPPGFPGPSMPGALGPTVPGGACTLTRVC